LEVGTIEHLIAWLETKNPAGLYCYESTGDCLLSHYAMDHGYGDGREAYHAFMRKMGVSAKDWATKPLAKVEPFHRVAVNEPYTFGAALDRARSFLQANAVSGSHV
jgi:hypothetical protein